MSDCCFNGFIYFSDIVSVGKISGFFIRLYLENNTVYTFGIPYFRRRDIVICLNKISPHFFYFRGKTIQCKIPVLKIRVPENRFHPEKIVKGKQGFVGKIMKKWKVFGKINNFFFHVTIQLLQLQQYRTKVFFKTEIFIMNSFRLKKSKPTSYTQ